MLILNNVSSSIGEFLCFPVPQLPHSSPIALLLELSESLFVKVLKTMARCITMFIKQKVKIVLKKRNKVIQKAMATLRLEP